MTDKPKDVGGETVALHPLMHQGLGHVRIRPDNPARRPETAADAEPATPGHGRHERGRAARWRAFWRGPWATPTFSALLVGVFSVGLLSVGTMLPPTNDGRSVMDVVAARAVGTTPVPVAGVIRNTGSGWAFINNTGHKPLRFTSVVDMGTYLRVNFDQTFAQVGAVAVSPDEEFARVGYRAGASVGYAYLNLYMYDAAGVLLTPAAVIAPTGNWWLTGTMWQ